MFSFSIPRITADRLARLGLACDTGAPDTALANVGIRVGQQAVRCSTTNGRILASLVIPLDDQDSTGEVILDREQLIAALKASAKGAAGRIQFTINDQEARISNGPIQAVVRRIPGTFPAVDHVWTKPSGRRWVPALCSLDHQLTTIAQKISGAKQPLLFSSPVDPGMRLERLWGTNQPDESIRVQDLRQAVTAPAYWSDHELAFLVMPITRPADERQLDLGRHVIALTTAAAAA